MKFINEFTEGCRVSGIYLCKTKTAAVTRNGKPYENVVLADKTGTIDAKIWEPGDPGIDDFEALSYVDVVGEVTSFNGALQLSIRRARVAREGEYDAADYLPASEKGTDDMAAELSRYIAEVKEPHLQALLRHFFAEDAEFMNTFRTASAAKSIHHGFIGGLLEHTVSVTRFCRYLADNYDFLNRDLLLASAMLHDIGKVRELSAFPQNDYTDDGQLLGHIVMGAEMIHDAARGIDGFPAELESELKHCILAHHGEYEYGSPKKPALAEALALNLADLADARLESMKELLHSAKGEGWLGYNRIFESNIRRT